MPSFLAEVLENKKSELVGKEKSLPFACLEKEVQKLSKKAFLPALSGPGLKLIAELKPRSPSLGQLAESKEQTLSKLVCYEKYATALSVLTDNKYFSGSMELLAEISSRTRLPLLMKDFVISPYQVYEGRKAGAHAVLLIVKILPFAELQSLFELVKDLGMDALVEVQCQEELALAAKLGADLILVNNRNLDDLSIDLATLGRLSGLGLCPDSILVGASGIESGKDLALLLPYADCFLIGSALMKADNLEQKFAEFLEAGSEFFSGDQRRQK